MNGSVTRIGKQTRNGLAPAIEFLIARMGIAIVSALITYASYRMFLL